MIKVYHLRRLTDEQVRAVNVRGWDASPETTRYADITTRGDINKIKLAFTLGEYVHVADVDSDDLDVAFEKTNHIDRSWMENEGVTAHGTRQRSTSVGDVLEVNGKLYAVSGVGFTALN